MPGGEGWRLEVTGAAAEQTRDEDRALHDNLLPRLLPIPLRLRFLCLALLKWRAYRGVHTQVRNPAICSNLAGA